MLTHSKRKRIPKAKDIVLMFRAILAMVPLHSPLQHGLRESLKGITNYRIASSTDDRFWSVDVYHNDYFVVTCRNLTQPCPSVRSAIGHLRMMLGLK